MIKFEHTDVYGFEAAVRGMRNPMNSWDKSDSSYCITNKTPNHCKDCAYKNACHADDKDLETNYIIGPNDLKRMMALKKGGTDHRKYLRMINVTVDITAPLYWWKEFDTYKVGTVANSCSTMHKIAEKEFTLNDFSHEHLDYRSGNVLKNIISVMNDYRELYINYNADDFEIKGCPSKKLIWWQMIQLLPSSYNQKRTVQLNYEVLANMCRKGRRLDHKLDEWSIGFMDWTKELPYAKELIFEEEIQDV